MPLELLTVPCLSDNYAFVIANSASGEAAVVDVPEAAPINAAVAQKGWKLTTVLITHHHFDHVQGLDNLNGRESLKVIGAKSDAQRLPGLDLAVSEGDQIDVCGETAEVIDVSGHTIGHIAFHFPKSKLAFTADSLMAMGCGRLFEGTPAQMWESLKKLRALPDETLICSGHEYTQSNAKFALSLEEENATLMSRIHDIDAARNKGTATVPSLLGLEKATNPFLRADDPALMASVGMANADPEAVFAEVRGRKDRF